MDWLDALVAADRDAQPAVLVTVLAARGSTPREAGAKMVVVPAGTAGTIGGGTLEYQCEAEARTLLAGGFTGPVTRDFPLGPALGQCCGGHVTVLFDVVRPASLQVSLFGAGHVGKALVRLMGDLPCRVTWVDPRADALPSVVPRNVRVSRDIAVGDVPSGSVVVVMTHDHALDFEIVAAALARNDLAFVGLIGSETKRARFVARLQRIGLATDRLVCPIGVPGIEGKEPAVVAVSVAAQLMQRSSATTPSDRPSRPLPTVAVPATGAADPAARTVGPSNVMAGPVTAAHDVDPRQSLIPGRPSAMSRSACADCVCLPTEVR